MFCPFQHEIETLFKDFTAEEEESKFNFKAIAENSLVFFFLLILFHLRAGPAAACD